MTGHVPLAAPVTLLRLPRAPAQAKGRDVVRAADGAVVAFVVHVRRWAQAQDAANQQMLQQAGATPTPAAPPTA